METFTRKQREIREREQLILNVSRRMLLERGYLGMTMDRIAEEVEYSKGTIYQHFTCKEDILTALCIQTDIVVLEMFNRAATFQGRTRERMAAMGEAYELFFRLHPDHFRSAQVIVSASIQAKASPEKVEKLRGLENQCQGIFGGLVRDAIAQGDLKMSGALTPDDIYFGLWSLTFGAYSIMATGMQLEELGIEEPFSAVRKNCHAYLDGCKWRPLSSEWNYDETYERIRNEVFPDEYRKARGK